MTKKQTKKSLNFAHAYPELAKEWHPKRNHPLKATNFSPNNTQKVWWRCPNGHDWEGRINARTMGLDCPECSLNSITTISTTTENISQSPKDIETLNLTHSPMPESNLSQQFPQLAKEWIADKNKGRTLDEFSMNSNFQAWWKCPTCDNQWQTPIKLRTKGSGCSKCAQRQRYVKVGENDLQTLHPTIATFWHPTLNANLTPTDFIATSKIEVWWKKECGHEYKRSILEEVAEQNCIVCESLGTKHPELLKEWNYRLNKQINPFHLPAKANKKIHWRCQKGHDFQTSIKHRLANPECPICAKTKNGNSIENSIFPNLKSELPSLAKQWHPTKNGEFTPTMIRPSSNRKVWWQCEHGHEWEESPIYRQRSPKCPSCQSLAFKTPTIAQIWHPTKNGDLTPWGIRSGSKQIVWWQCSCGHEWQNEVKQQRHIKKCAHCHQPFNPSTPSPKKQTTKLTSPKEKITINPIPTTPESIEATRSPQEQISQRTPLTQTFPLTSFDLWTFQIPTEENQFIDYLVFNHAIYKKENNKAIPLTSNELTTFFSYLFNQVVSQVDVSHPLPQKYEINKDLLNHLGFKDIETFKNGNWEGTEFLKLSSPKLTIHLSQSFKMENNQLTTDSCSIISETIYSSEKQQYARQLAEQLRQAGIHIELP